MKLKLLFLSIFLALPVLVLAQTSTFTRSLRLGVSGEDVRALQVLLNSDTETRIAESGAGSPGSETDYFGPATRRAVIKFQEKYRSEVLDPAGISTGTGFFGESSRAKASSLLSDVKIVVPITPVAQVPIDTGLKGVVVKTPSQYSGKPGTTITISGWGFTKTGNTVYFGDSNKIDNVTSSDGYSISVVIPNIPVGVYTVSVKNSNGDSQTKTFFAVTDGLAVAPKIESITPDHATRGDTVTIKGSGFAKTGNTLRTTLKVFDNISSADGVTMSFVVPVDTFSAPPAGFNIPVMPQTIAKATSSLPVWVYVVNANGVSNTKSFTGDF